MGKRIQKKKDLKSVFLFLLKLNLFLLPFYAIIYFDVTYYPIQIAFSWVVFFLTNLIGMNVKMDGAMLYIGESNYPVYISFDCIGWKSSYSLIALVLASPGFFREKAAFIAKWVPVIIIINIARVVIAIGSGVLINFEFMKALHDYIMQPAMILIVFLIWSSYIKSLGKEDKIYSIRK
ncbi:MAG: archaeosortase/exosortase family protein [Candidatus Aenigmatarchaeota archaeon]